MCTMEKRIELERRGRPVHEVVDLNLDNCRATQISGLTNDFVKLEALSLINVGLTSLKGFPSLPSLKRLELSDNRISSGLQLLNGCPKLSYVNLSGNKIKDIKTLEPLKELAELKTLDLYNCDVTNEDSYRDEVFDLLQGLEYLDGYDRDNEEAEDEEEEEAESVEHTEDVHDGDDEEESGDSEEEEGDSSDEDDAVVADGFGLIDDNDNVGGLGLVDIDGYSIDGFVGDGTDEDDGDDDNDENGDEVVAEESESLESETSGDQGEEEVYADENFIHGKKRKLEEDDELGE